MVSDVSVSSLLRPKCIALHECMNKLADLRPVVLCRDDDFIRQIFIGKAEGTSQGILDQVLGEAAGKVVFPVSDQITQFVVITEGGALVKCPGGVDGPRLSLANAPASIVLHLIAVFCSPFSVKSKS